MPKEITHILLGDKMLSGLSNNARQAIENNINIFYFGTMSPDLFYYDVRLPFEKIPSAEVFAEHIHGRSGNSNMDHVYLMLERARTLDQGDRYFAFVAGYLSHVAADTFFHPMIYSITGNYYAESALDRLLAQCRHRVYESSLDLHLLNQTSQSLEEFDMPGKLKLPNDFKNKLIPFFADVLRDTFDPTFPLQPAAFRAVRKSRFLQTLMVSRRAYRFFSYLNRLASYEYDFFINLFYPETPASIEFETSKTTPHPVSGKPYKRDVKFLTRQAIKRGENFIQSAWDFYKGKINKQKVIQAIPPLSLNNGIPNMPVSRMLKYKILPGIESFRNQE
ncbi:MAG: zinc dependent phospholipase C family protein [Spirochaetia bacterium]|nr:zinc dependent phospholipase C family protein [Spirochaetia bacterium]